MRFFALFLALAVVAARDARTSYVSLSCSSYHDCWSCLNANSDCLWDPNNHNCKPSRDCDFTYAAPRAAFAVASAQYTTACIRTTSQCGVTPPNGAVLVPNNNCNYNTCTRCAAASGCVWNGGCYASNFPCSGPGCANYASDCHAITSGSCTYHDCHSCAAATGCVWNGYCYYATVPCSGPNCANTPDQCFQNTHTCNYNDCMSCAGANGCVWNGFCYATSVPCSGSGCANTPDQCPRWPARTCSNHYDCWSCLNSGSGCLWDPNNHNCKTSSDCDFTYAVPRLATAAYSASYTTACVRTTAQCGVTPPNGAVLVPNCGSHYTCSSCTDANGCVWNGVCYASSFPCSGPGCANYPSQCGGYSTSCDYHDCRSCAAANGCVWNNGYCYYTTVPCSGPQCANNPNQCPSSWTSCNYHDCGSCTAAYGCVWKGYCYATSVPCFGAGCANTPDQCWRR